MRNEITYGTFDTLHYGHILLLKRARELGDRLIVAVSSNEFNAQKGKKTYLDYLTRREIVMAIRYVDMVIPETSWEQKASDIREHEIDVFVMGDDWQGKFDFLKPHCEVVYLPRTPAISSTFIKSGLE